MTQLADLSYRQRGRLGDLHDAPHYLTRKGARRRTRPGEKGGHETMTFAVLEPLRERALIAVGTIEGRKAIVITPAGKALVNQMRRRPPVRKTGVSAPPPRDPDQPDFWWQR